MFHASPFVKSTEPATHLYIQIRDQNDRSKCVNYLRPTSNIQLNATNQTALTFSSVSQALAQLTDLGPTNPLCTEVSMRICLSGRHLHNARLDKLNGIQAIYPNR